MVQLESLLGKEVLCTLKLLKYHVRCLWSSSKGSVPPACGVCVHGGSQAEGHFTVETLRLDLKALISRLGEKDIQGTL